MEDHSPHLGNPRNLDNLSSVVQTHLLGLQIWKYADLEVFNNFLLGKNFSDYSQIPCFSVKTSFISSPLQVAYVADCCYILW